MFYLTILYDSLLFLVVITFAFFSIIWSYNPCFFLNCSNKMIILPLVVECKRELVFIYLYGITTHTVVSGLLTTSLCFSRCSNHHLLSNFQYRLYLNNSKGYTICIQGVVIETFIYKLSVRLPSFSIQLVITCLQ